MAKLFDLLFGCSHKNYTFPITLRNAKRRGIAGGTNTYVVCLDCGKEFPYDWKEMKMVANPRAATNAGRIAEPVESYAVNKAA